MLTPDSTEELNKDYDDMSCVTGVMGTVGTSFGHAVDETKSKLKTKHSAAAWGNLQDYMDAISHEPSKWEDLEHCNMTHDLGGGGGWNLSGSTCKK